LVFWVLIYGALAGDEEHFEFYGPDGKIFAERRSRIAGNKAEWYAFVGKKLAGKSWPLGVYRAEYALIRRTGNAPQKVIAISREMRMTR
jgi:hypothetical protein